MIKTIVVDDNVPFRKALIAQLEHFDIPVVVIAEAGDCTTGRKLINENRPELVFMDIELPDGKGFEIIEGLEYTPFIIFISSHEEFALEAFEYSALHYLVKPINVIKLKEAVSKYFIYQDNLSQKSEQTINSDTFPILAQKLAIPTQDGIKFFDFSSIIRFEGASNYTTVYLIDGTKIVISKTMAIIEELLPPNTFIRLHKSHIVNYHFITGMRKEGNIFIDLVDNTEIQVAQTRKKEVLEKLSKFAKFIHSSIYASFTLEVINNVNNSNFFM